MRTGVSKEFYEPGRFQTGFGMTGVSLLSEIFILPGAVDSQSPLLYVVILGGFFAIPGILGVALIVEQWRLRKHQHRRSRASGSQRLAPPR
jgi:hypothetical protein